MTTNPPDLRFVAVPPGSISRDYVPTDEADLLRCLGDPLWRIESGQIYKITVKDGEGDTIVPFKPNRAQRRFVRRMWHRNVILKARQLGFCVDPSTRVLTAGLEWVPIGEIQPGAEVIAVDEHPPGGRGQSRKMRTATVQAVRKMQAERLRITFDDGRQVVCTDRHPWLTKKAGDMAEWRSLSGTGNQVVGRIKVGTKVRWITKPWDAPTVEDGWFGGMLDGEGSMALPARSGASVNVSQRTGPVWDRLEKYAVDRGYHARIENEPAERPSKFGKTPVPKLTFTRMDELFRLIGQARPTRFIDRRWWEGRELPGKRNGDVGWSTVTRIEHLGMGEVVDMQTSTGTYIAEGFVSHNTTLISIMWLDHALFNSNQLCVQIAQTREDAEAIFQKKVLTAYDNMPEALRAAKPLKRRTATQIEICNGSVVKVSSSARSGTAHRLHVSEMGKIGAKYPEKAREIVSGSFPAVPKDGIIIVESTAEGEDGEFKKIVDGALDLVAAPTLNPKQFRFHFYPWWAEPGYRLTPAEARAVAITEKEHEYFDKVELQIGRKLDICQRAWWVTTFVNECLCDFELMWREFPSTAEEPFQVATDGTYYAEQLRRAREGGRIGAYPYLDGFPVNTFWDIGSGDGTAIWLHQYAHGMDRFFAFVENWEQPYSHYITELQRIGLKHDITWGVHHLPHDADNQRQQGTRICSPREELEELKGIGGSWVVVPRVAYLIHGINATRKKFASYCFDEQGCSAGLKHLARYRKKWNRAISAFGDEPVKDKHTEAADALRQHGQYFTPAKPKAPQRDNSHKRNWRVV